MNVAVWVLSIVAICTAGYAHAEVDIYTENRYQGEPLRDGKGNIIRSQKVIRAFRAIHPCPATGMTSGACDGWAVDHVIPLACGGYDAVFNMQWLPTAIKSSAGVYSKDRFERKIYAAPKPYNNTPSCRNEVVE